ncbi:lysostaphin resistance A-like protein [Niabella sp. CJ426]|uniref:CPBP family intramembrane glutamic endopeptidase n=1 Tax=Niabella sp. CJ426 TaxID=3393740 RepID=UPI003D00A95B
MIAGTVFSLPMFVGGLLQSKLAADISIPNLIAKTIFAGLFEELYFRGFLFGQLFRKTRLGFLPAIILCSVIFAMGHLYQSQDPGVLLGVFLTTFMGSVLFAWLFVEWNYNLWIPVFMHTMMNLSWHLFAVSENALGTASFNIYRGITIALAIVLTIMYKKRNGHKLSVNKQTLLFSRLDQNFLNTNL